MGRGNAGAASAIVAGGFCILVLVLLGVAATIILSLISLYTPNNSEEGYGAEFRINTLMLKMSYENGSYTFLGGSVANNTQMSELCDTQFTNQGTKNLAGCILTNGDAWGPTNSSASLRRRRRAVIVGAFLVYEARIFFSSKCPRKADENKTESSSSLSACVKQLLAQCNALVKNTSSTFHQWTMTSSFTLSIEDTDGNIVTVTPTQIFGVPPVVAATIAKNTLTLNNEIINELSSGCQYVGGRSMAEIRAILASHVSDTLNATATTQPTG